ncbi:hypothetical protein F4808DRAFT_194530 [Astrocystis sublimbata]|nr:hypothetical protein F4808DRAFT_194530 [Astrocystis sublimbata]
MSSYEARRLANIKRNESLVKGLGLRGELVTKPKSSTSLSQTHSEASTRERPSKRRKLQQAPPQPTRSSARIATAASKLTYTEDDDEDEDEDDEEEKGASYQTRATRSVRRRRLRRKAFLSPTPEATPSSTPAQDISTNTTSDPLEKLREGWSSWKPSAPPPTRDDEGVYHFASHPMFTPNKSPEAIIREGSFGGSYWRPLWSRHLRTTISDDWKELPESWTDGLSTERYLTSETYDPEVNKYGVACGQSIEEWEAAGWIVHEYDVRGWFQWYCRFWMGRRCGDDERQISRWRKCVGETGRWRRILLKKYIQNGIRTVTDEDDEVEEKNEVSPVVHQTCHHWAYEVRQEALDRFWSDGT